jgi:rhodanese-related sulfurtransferase
MLEHWYYLIPVAAIGFLWWTRRSASATDVKAMLERNAQVVDVRTKAEFKANAHPRTINIPLDQLEARLKELDKNRPVLLCCDSGSRSGFGVPLLKRDGFKEVANLGSYRRLQSLLS